MKFLIFVLLGVCLAYAKPAPKHELSEFDEKESDNGSRKSPKCYDLLCPSGTVGCSRTSKTSKDRKVIVTNIQCEDFNGRVLKVDTSSKPNPDENAIIHSFSFSKVFSFSTGDHATRNVDAHERVDDNDEVETF